MAAVSIQLYTLRDQLSSDRDATLAAVAAMGVDEVEPFGIENFDWLPEALAAHGLKAGSAHAGLLADPEKVLAAAKTLGVSTVFQPFYEPEKWLSAEGIRELADGLNAQVDRFADAGLDDRLPQPRLGVHGSRGRRRRRPTTTSSRCSTTRIVLEVDTYWAAAGGRDVPALLATYGDRITHLHIKDGPLQPSRSGAANVVLGNGLMDIPPILDASPNRTWVCEFDFAAVDPIEEVRQSIAYLKER